MESNDSVKNKSNKRDNKKSIELTGKIAYNSDMVKKYRLKLNLSQEQLADELGISLRTVRNIESGRTASNTTVKAIKAWVEEVAYQERMATKSIQK